jgi:DNA-binding MarR family transcriptional regulator
VSTDDPTGPGVDDAVRTMLLLMPRLVGRAKRLGVPAELRDLNLAPRHLSLLSYLLFDGPLSVTDLAARLEVAPTTVSLMISELTRRDILTRDPDPTDRRRAVIAIAGTHRPAIDAWLSRAATAWHTALAPLTPAERRLVVGTLRAYEEAVSG